jgi:GntR family transcriptional regulator
MTCFLEDLIALGIPAVPSVSDVAMVEASPTIAKSLELTDDLDVQSFLRVLNVEEKVFSVRRFFLPSWVAEQMTRQDFIQENLLKTISAKCNIQVTEADQSIEAVMADVEMANLLEVTAGAPLLSVTRTSYTRARIPVEHSVTYYRSDRTRFFISQRQRKKDGDDWVLGARGTARSAELN